MAPQLLLTLLLNCQPAMPVCVFLQVANRRAWADPHCLTPELLSLYQRPLHVQGWDRALIEVC